MTAILHDIQHRLQDPSIPWQKVVLGIGLAVSVAEGAIGSRQKPYYSPVAHPHIPASLQPYLPASQSHQTYLKSQKYALAKLRVGSVLNVIDIVETYLLLSSALAPVWDALGLPETPKAAPGSFPFLNGRGNWTLLSGLWDLAARMPLANGSELKQSMWFVVLMTVIGTVIGLPKSWYKTFVLEEEHGFNKTTTKTWIADQVKGFFVGMVLELPVLAGILKIISWAGNDGVLEIVKWLMLFIFSFQIILIPLYPYVIAPLFNTFTPLPVDAPVYPFVRELADRLNFPLGRVWVMDGSKRSAHSNAFFFGLPLLTKHIVIYDTLLEKSEPEEVQAILAHELGHWSHSHVPILLATSLVQTAFSLLSFTLFLNHTPLLTAFSLPPPTPSHPETVVALLLAASLFTPLSAVLRFMTNTITRTLEYDADAFAVGLGKQYAVRLKTALVRIHEENLAIYGVDWIYSAYNNNHPTLVERLEALDARLEVLDGSEEEKKKTK